MILLIVHRGLILVKGDTWPIRETIAALPGARWDRVQKAWGLPATSASARAAVAALPSAQLDAGVTELLEAAERADAAQSHKTACELPEIPRVVLPPWRHQLQAYHYAHDLPASMLALDMGTGKSRVVVDLAVNLGLHRVLILCPLSVVEVWREQFRRHAACPVRVLCLGDDYGSVAAKARALETIDASERGPLVVAINYEAAWREPLAEVLVRRRWPLVVADESHRCKAPGGKQSLFLARMRDRADRRMCLTGTPMPHSPLDIYAQYRFLDPGIFGTSFVRFRARYAVMGGYQQHQVVAFQRQDELQSKLYSIAFRVRAGDVLDLPPVQHIERTFRLSGAESRVYGELESALMAEVEAGTITAANGLVRLLRLAQVTSGYAPLDNEAGEAEEAEVGTSKRELLADVLDDLSPREPVVVFARFHHDLDAIRAVCAAQGRTCGELSGRQSDIARWQAGELDVLAVQLQSGGVGIDLTRARYAIYYGIDWSLGNYDQSLARLHRPGQAHPVVYVHLIAEHTVDRTVYDALAARRDVVEAVLATLTPEGRAREQS